MVYLYMNKAEGPIPAGSVERFSDAKAAELLLKGDAVRFDPKKHGKKQNAPRLGAVKQKG